MFNVTNKKLFKLTKFFMKHPNKVLFICTLLICSFVCLSFNASAQANVTIIDNTTSQKSRVIGTQKPTTPISIKSQKASKANFNKNPQIKQRSDSDETTSEKISKVKTRINEYVSKNCCIEEIEKLEKYLCDLESQEK